MTKKGRNYWEHNNKGDYTIDIYDDGFTAMPIESMDEITPSRGATGGLLYPSGIAKHYCDIDNLTIGSIMSYGFRRFGYPINGWDDYKQLCEWIIKTPMDGVFLTVQPTVHSPFGYLLRDPLQQTLSDEQAQSSIEWGKQCRAWARDTYNIILIHNFHWAGHYTDEELEISLCEWLYKTYSDVEGNTLKIVAEKLGLTKDAIIKHFFKEKRQECEKYTEEYKHINPRPERNHLWENMPKDSLERQMNEAIYRTIIDLKRPVNIRDWQIDITGKCSGEGFRVFTEDDDGYEEITEDYFAPIAKTAGYGLGALIKNNIVFKQ